MREDSKHVLENIKLIVFSSGIQVETGNGLVKTCSKGEIINIKVEGEIPIPNLFIYIEN